MDWYEPQWVSTAQVVRGSMMFTTPLAMEQASRTSGSANGTKAVTTSLSPSIFGGYNAPDAEAERTCERCVQQWLGAAEKLRVCVVLGVSDQLGDGERVLLSFCSYVDRGPQQRLPDRLL